MSRLWNVIDDKGWGPMRTEVSPIVRVATARDTNQIVNLINQAYDVEKFFVDGDRIDSHEVKHLQNQGLFLVLDKAKTNGLPHDLAASIYIEIQGNRGYFSLLSVDPRLQGSGLGRRLIAVVEALCEAQGCKNIHIEVVNLRTELPPWYRRQGYCETGLTPFPETPHLKEPCHFIQMKKTLGPRSVATIEAVV